jgi:hypothetical protein
MPVRGEIALSPCRIGEVGPVHLILDTCFKNLVDRVKRLGGLPLEIGPQRASKDFGG